MWREIAKADIPVNLRPHEVVERLRKATDPRLFPPSHRWSPRGLHLATAATDGDRFDILYFVQQSRFRARGSAIRANGASSMVTVTLTEDPWGLVMSIVCLLGGVAVLALGWTAIGARLLGGWLLFMAGIGVAHLRMARSRARSMIQALAAFWLSTSVSSGAVREPVVSRQDAPGGPATCGGGLPGQERE